MEIRIRCKKCQTPVEFSFDYPDTIAVEPCECTAGTVRIDELEEELREEQLIREKLEDKNQGLENLIGEKDDAANSLQVAADDRDSIIDRLQSKIEDLKLELDRYEFL